MSTMKGTRKRTAFQGKRRRIPRITKRELQLLAFLVVFTGILFAGLVGIIVMEISEEGHISGREYRENAEKSASAGENIIEISDREQDVLQGSINGETADQKEPYTEADIPKQDESLDEQTEEDSTETESYGDPLYCTIWAIQKLNVYEKPDGAEQVGTVEGGQTLCVLAEDGDYFQVSYDGDLHTGYIDKRFCMINLSEYLGSLCRYNITNSYASVFKIHDYEIPEITGTVIPGFEDIALNLGTGEFVVPYLYPCANRLMRAAEKVREDGYVLNIYESFRPHKATRFLYDSVEVLLAEPLPDAAEEERTMPQEEVDRINQERLNESMLAAQSFLLSQGIDPSSPEALPIVQYYLDNTEQIEASTYTYQRTYQEEMTNGSYKLSAFLAKQISAHNRGIALDLTLQSLETGEDLTMQSAIHDLSYHSVINANNENAALLDTYMKAEGFNGIVSEWWHFQDDITRNEIGLSTYLEEGVSLEGFKADPKGFRYQNADGSFVTDTERTIDGKKYRFDKDGYCKIF